MCDMIYLVLVYFYGCLVVYLVDPEFEISSVHFKSRHFFWLPVSCNIEWKLLVLEAVIVSKTMCVLPHFSPTEKSLDVSPLLR